MQNVIASANCIDVLNKLDKLVFELLYSNENGYITLVGKSAIDEADKVISKFNQNASKIVQQYNIKNIDEVIDEKRQELLQQVKKHYDISTETWAQNVFDELIENCLLIISVNKDDKGVLDKYYNRIISAIDWIAKIKKQNPEKLKKEINTKFLQALNSKDSDYIAKNQAAVSDIKLFLNLRKMSIENEDEFIKEDFTKYTDKLTKVDINYLSKIKFSLSTTKKTSKIDELKLVDEACKILNLDDKSKYDFIKQVDNDFSDNANKITEKERVEIVKRRMSILKDSTKYFKNLLTSS